MSKVAVITGATRGIGAATAAGLANKGYTVVVTGRAWASVDRVARALRADGADARAVTLDVTSPDSIAAAAGFVGAEFGYIDVLVNNAGILPEATSRGNDAVAATFATNAVGPMMVTEAFLSLLRQSSAGRIVNVSTRMGSLSEQANPASAYYSMIVPAYQASKAALNSYTISLSKALADTNIVVTSVCPGFVQTELTPSNKDQAPTTPDQAAQIVLVAATARTGSLSGTFVDTDGPISW